LPSSIRAGDIFVSSFRNLVGQVRRFFGLWRHFNFGGSRCAAVIFEQD
jgi:hypothetical protein